MTQLVFLVVTLCSDAIAYQHFGGHRCLQQKPEVLQLEHGLCQR